MKFTEGPWKVIKPSRIDKWIEIDGPGIRVDYDDVDPEEAEGNAYLAAAAPDLYGALKFIMAFYDPDANKYLDTEAWKVAEASGRRALRMARGE